MTGCPLCDGSGTAFAGLLGETRPCDVHEYPCPLCRTPYARDEETA